MSNPNKDLLEAVLHKTLNPEEDLTFELVLEQFLVNAAKLNKPSKEGLSSHGLVLAWIPDLNQYYVALQHFDNGKRHYLAKGLGPTISEALQVMKVENEKKG